MTSAHISLLIAALCQAGPSQNLAVQTATLPCRWDNQYRSVVEGVPVFADPTNGATARTELLQMAQWIRSRRERAELEAAVSKLPPSRARVRLEACYGSSDEYEGVWVIDNGAAGASVVAYGRKGLRTSAVSHAVWNDLETRLSGTKLRGAINWPYPDGPGFFVSWEVPGGCGQFAVFAPTGSPVPEADREFNRATSREREIIRLLLQVGRDSAP